MLSARARLREILSDGAVGSKITVRGWVRTRRDSKGFSFFELNDGSCLKNLQLVADDALPNYVTEVMEAHTGASIEVEGTLVESPGKGQRVELKVEKFALVGFWNKIFDRI